MKEFDPDELAACNGREGRPVYIAHNGRVYDVSPSKMWTGGTHMKRHPAGRDLSADIHAAPHGPDVLERYPQIGTLARTSAAAGNLPMRLESLLERFPFLRRHPHPMAVHFPMVFLISPALFMILFITTGERSFEATSFHCLGAGLLMLFPAILTGFLTWRVNYQARPIKPVKIKIVLSLMLCALSVLAFLWRLSEPELLLSMNASGLAYFFIVFSLMPIVSAVGFYGGKLTFPYE
jgi:predicted heme/steroid binding protein/uncharacterized membrane protein